MYSTSNSYITTLLFHSQILFLFQLFNLFLFQNLKESLDVELTEMLLYRKIFFQVSLLISTLINAHFVLRYCLSVELWIFLVWALNRNRTRHTTHTHTHTHVYTSCFASIWHCSCDNISKHTEIYYVHTHPLVT